MGAHYHVCISNGPIIKCGKAGMDCAAHSSRIFATIGFLFLILFAALLTPLSHSEDSCQGIGLANMANNEQTFIMIKPDGVARGLVGEIIKRFEAKVYYNLQIIQYTFGSCIWYVFGIQVAGLKRTRSCSRRGASAQICNLYPRILFFSYTANPWPTSDAELSTLR